MLKSMMVTSLPTHDLAALGGAAQQRLQRAPLFLAGAQVDGRIEGPGQRPEQQQDGQDFGPHRGAAVVRCRRPRRRCSTENGRTATVGTPLGRQVVVADLFRPAPQHVREPGEGDLRFVVGRAVDDFGTGDFRPAPCSASPRWPPFRRPVLGLAADGLAEGVEPAGEVGREIQRRFVLARLHLAIGLGPRVGPRFVRLPAARRAQSAVRAAAPAPDRRTTSAANCSFSNSGGRSAQVPGAHHQHPRRLLLHELRDLQQAHPQQRIEQDRQHRNHEQRPPIAELIADFAGQDQFDVGEGHGLGAKPQAARVMSIVVLRDQLKEQLLQVPLVMPVAQLLQRPFGQDLSAVQDGDPVAEPLRLAHDVRGEDDALAVIAQLGHRVQQRPGHQHVQPGRGLVEDQHGRIVDHGPGHRNLLLHAGRHLRAQDVPRVVHLQPVEERLHPIGQRRPWECRAAGRSIRPSPSRSCGRRRPCWPT